MFSIQDRQETFQDAEYAVAVLQKIKAEVSENEIQHSTIEVPAMQLRNCMELLLSMLEAYEGLDVSCIEAYQELHSYLPAMNPQRFDESCMH